MTLIQLEFTAGKICYQCDEKNPSSKFKIIGEKITKCNGVPFEKYATKTSKAFGAAVLTCFTVIHRLSSVIFICAEKEKFF